jgi:hypothetical protein
MFDDSLESATCNAREHLFHVIRWRPSSRHVFCSSQESNRLKRTIELSIMDLESDWKSHVKRCKIIYNGCYIALQTTPTIDSTAGFTTLSDATLALNDEKPSPHVPRRLGGFSPELRRKLVLRLQSRAGHSLELVPVSTPGFNLGFNPHSKTCSVSRFINIFAS